MTLKIIFNQKILIMLFIIAGSLFAQEYEEAKKTVVSLIDNLKSKNNLEMNNQNYDYIYEKIISKYNDTIKKLKKNKEEQKYLDSLMEAAKYELDINRHKYLENQMKKIEKIKSVTQIDKMINEIYHNSTRGYEKGFIFDKSYKSYWEDIKKDYLKNLKKNNMKLVENYINRLGIFSLEPKDIGDKGYDIKYKYLIEKNIHYVDCNIEEFVLSAYNDKFLGWVLFNDYSDSKYHFKFKMENVDTFSMDARGWSRLGLLYYRNGQYNKAIEYRLKAVKLEPNNEDNWLGLGLAYYENRQYKEAINSFKKAVELKPNNDINWYWLGFSYIGNEQYKEAINPLKKAAELKPNDAYNWLWLGLSYYRNGQYEEAIKAFRKVLELDPNDEDAKKMLKYSIEKLNKK